MDKRRLLATFGAGSLLAASVMGAPLVGATQQHVASQHVAFLQHGPQDQQEDTQEGADTPLTGSELDRASSVALDYVGEGKVTGTEAGDEEGAYEVEVTRNDGSQVDVHLDENFTVVSGKGDDQEHGDQDVGNQAEDGDQEGSGDASTTALGFSQDAGDSDTTVPAGTIDDGKELLPQADITLDQAIATALDAENASQSDLGEIDLEDYQGNLVFNVDVGSHDVKVDAKTGAVLGAVTEEPAAD